MNICRVPNHGLCQRDWLMCGRPSPGQEKTEPRLKWRRAEAETCFYPFNYDNTHNRNAQSMLLPSIPWHHRHSLLSSQIVGHQQRKWPHDYYPLKVKMENPFLVFGKCLDFLLSLSVIHSTVLLERRICFMLFSVELFGNSAFSLSRVLLPLGNSYCRWFGNQLFLILHRQWIVSNDTTSDPFSVLHLTNRTGSGFLLCVYTEHG